MQRVGRTCGEEGQEVCGPWGTSFRHPSNLQRRQLQPCRTLVRRGLGKMPEPPCLSRTISSHSQAWFPCSRYKWVCSVGSESCGSSTASSQKGTQRSTFRALVTILPQPPGHVCGTPRINHTTSPSCPGSGRAQTGKSDMLAFKPQLSHSATSEPLLGK